MDRKIHTIYLVEVLKINDMMAWWHDAMQMMLRRMQQANTSHGETRNSWKSSGASVSGRYNTPPLQEDLVLRSRMAPERNGRGREEVKLSCFCDQWVKPKNLEGLKSYEWRVQWTRKNWNHSGWNEINKERGRSKSDSTPVEKRCKTW